MNCEYIREAALTAALAAGLVMASCNSQDSTSSSEAENEVPLPHFSFFVTSLKAMQELSGNAEGFGGDLRYGEEGPGAGLRGADKICAGIAEMSMPGSSTKQWRAFLSATADENGQPVHAIERIGEGPWYDRLGRLLAPTKADLVSAARPQNGDPAIQNDLPNEDGVPNHQPDPNQPPVDNHHMLTGSGTDGMLDAANATCQDWTTDSGANTSDSPRAGLAWPRASNRGNHWISELAVPGCAIGVGTEGRPPSGSDDVGSGGGYGGIYMFCSRTLIATFRGALYCCVILAPLLFASSCGKDNPSDDGGTAAGVVDPFGTFQVSLVAPQRTTPGFTAVLGRLQDGPTPSAIIWEEAEISGDCRLLTPRVPFCEQPCGSGALCVEDGQCQTFPDALTVGTVRVDGLHTTAGETSFSMDPIANNYQPPAGTQLAFPAFSAGDDITFTAGGDASEFTFSVSAKGISPLQVANETIELTGEPILLEWTPAGQEEETTISVTFDISYHGGTKGKVVCDCPDTDSLDVSASLLDELKALGISGFPKLEIARRSKGSTEPPAQIDLVVESMVTRILEIPGVTSCNGDGDCSGQSCRPDFRCQ